MSTPAPVTLPALAPPAAHRQRGAALAVALIILVVLTLLGLAAVRLTQTELRMAQNAESQMTALQRADSNLQFVLSNKDSYLPVNNEAYRACYLPSPVPPSALFTCEGGIAKVAIPKNGTVDDELSRSFAYTDIIRVLPLFVSVNNFRSLKGAAEGNSGRNYDFAHYEVTAGFNHAQAGFSAAEIAAGVLVLHVKPTAVYSY